MDIDKAYRKWTIRRKLKSGKYSIRCRKGLWAVYIADKDEADRMARHYFALYYQDGEYDDPRITPQDAQKGV